MDSLTVSLQERIDRLERELTTAKTMRKNSEQRTRNYKTLLHDLDAKTSAYAMALEKENAMLRGDPNPVHLGAQAAVEALWQCRDLKAEVALLEGIKTDYEHQMGNLGEEVAKLRVALEESVKLQSHYARLLNMHDGGERVSFVDANQWLARLETIGWT